MTNQFLVTMSIVALAIGLTAMIAGAICRRAAPSVRNLVWNAALVACAVAPFALMLGPQLPVQIPARLVATASQAMGSPTNRAANLPSAPQAEVSPRAFETGSHLTSEAIGKATLLIWLSGMVFFAIRFLRQLLFARGLVRRGTRAKHDKLDPLLAAAKSALGIRADVTVLESAEIDIPIATGILHPTILLPASANEWSDDELRVVLLHELAHVRRADIWARAAAMVACGLHWFNPVVWMLSALATRDAEHAADDLVLARRCPAFELRRHFLESRGQHAPLSDAQPAMRWRDRFPRDCVTQFSATRNPPRHRRPHPIHRADRQLRNLDAGGLCPFLLAESRNAESRAKCAESAVCGAHDDRGR
jgi:beta-lactamase regulating signal transducer with metallopeptidase domain